MQKKRVLFVMFLLFITTFLLRANQSGGLKLKNVNVQKKYPVFSFGLDKENCSPQIKSMENFANKKKPLTKKQQMNRHLGIGLGLILPGAICFALPGAITLAVGLALNTIATDNNAYGTALATAGVAVAGAVIFLISLPFLIIGAYHIYKYRILKTNSSVGKKKVSLILDYNTNKQIIMGIGLKI